jgi:hypothetical protein
VFLAHKAPSPARQPAADDIDPDTGRARLSYRRAEEIFKAASGGPELRVDGASCWRWQQRQQSWQHRSDRGFDPNLYRVEPLDEATVARHAGRGRATTGRGRRADSR